MIIPIKASVFQQMFEYAYWAKEHYNSEIAGWAHIDQEKGVYKLAPLTKQDVSKAEVDTFPDEILRDPNYDMSDMLVQWHSHVDMACFSSSTDKSNTAKSLGLLPYVVNIIVNCKGEYHAELAIKKIGGSMPYIFSNYIVIEVELEQYYDERLSEEVKEKLIRTAVVPTTNKPSYQYFGFSDTKKNSGDSLLNEIRKLIEDNAAYCYTTKDDDSEIIVRGKYIPSVLHYKNGMVNYEGTSGGISLARTYFEDIADFENINSYY